MYRLLFQDIPVDICPEEKTFIPLYENSGNEKKQKADLSAHFLF